MYVRVLKKTESHYFIFIASLSVMGWPWPWVYGFEWSGLVNITAY